MLALAGLGGHVKNNGDSGWLVRGRGFQYRLMLAGSPRKEVINQEDVHVFVFAICWASRQGAPERRDQRGEL